MNASRGPAPHGWRSVGRALRQRNFKLFFGGQSVSLIGTWMTQVATAWLVYRLTGSAMWLGVVTAAGQIPTFLLAPVAGVWVDRWVKRRVLVGTQTLAMLQSFALALLAFTHINLAEILGLSAFQGLINAFDMPGRQSFMVDMVGDRELLSNAIALNSSMVNLARLAGPAIAGLIIAAWGEKYCFLIDGVSYIAVIVSLLAMRNLPQRAAGAQPDAWRSLREGWEYVSRFPPVQSLLVLTGLVGLVAIPYGVLVPIFAGQVLHGGAHTYGFLLAASGCGALAGALWLASRKSARGLTRVVPLTAALFGAGLVGFGLSHWFWLSLALMFCIGTGMMVQLAATNTILQTISAEEMRGRVMSYYTMAFVGMTPWGSLLVGALASRFGAPATLVVTGVCCCASAWWFTTRLETVRAAIRPIYQRLGIIPEMAGGIQAASTLTTPPEK